MAQRKRRPFSAEFKSVPRFLDHYALRILDKLGIDAEGAGLRWGGEP